MSVPIYSSVSGTVFKVDTSIDATGYRKPCIIINVEGDEWEESIDRSDKLETLEAHTELYSRGNRKPHQGSRCHWYGWSPVFLPSSSFVLLRSKG